MTFFFRIMACTVEGLLIKVSLEKAIFAYTINGMEWNGAHSVKVNTLLA